MSEEIIPNGKNIRKIIIINILIRYIKKMYVYILDTFIEYWYKYNIISNENIGRYFKKCIYTSQYYKLHHNTYF